jgi:hypothetical protein
MEKILVQISRQNTQNGRRQNVEDLQFKEKNGDMKNQ